MDGFLSASFDAGPASCDLPGRPSRQSGPGRSPDGRRIVCRAEGSIFVEGDPTHHRYEVVSGVVRACKLLPDGRRQILDFYLPGDHFGHDEPGARHSFSAEAAGTDETILMRRGHRPPSAHDPDACRSLCERALRSLERTRARLLILGRMEAPERLAAFLLEMELRLRSHGPVDAAQYFVLPMSRRDAADYLGITPETLSRCIQDLHRRLVIEVIRQRQVTIMNRRILVGLSSGVATRAGGYPGHDDRRLPAVA